MSINFPDMKNIIVVTPTEKESTFFLEHGILVYHCGVGMAECAAATAKLIIENKPDLMILAGIAGAYSDNIEIGETVVVESEVIADLGRLDGRAFTELYQKTYMAPVTVPGYRSAKSNTTSCAGAMISQPVQADIENMEGAAFFAMCDRFAVPALEVRTVSNKVGFPIGGKNMIIATNRLALELEKILALMAEK